MAPRRFYKCLNCGNELSYVNFECPKCHFENVNCAICSKRISPESLKSYVTAHFKKYYHRECLEKLFSLPVGLSCGTCGNVLSQNWLSSFFQFNRDNERTTNRKDISHLIAITRASCPKCGAKEPLRIWDFSDNENCQQCFLPILKFHEHTVSGGKNGGLLTHYHALCKPNSDSTYTKNLDENTKIQPTPIEKPDEKPRTQLVSIKNSDKNLNSELTQSKNSNKKLALKERKQQKDNSINIFIPFFLGILLSFAIAAALIYWGSTWRISNPDLEKFVNGFNVVNLAENILGLKTDFDPSKIIRKKKLDGYDALRNAFSLYVSCATVLPFLFMTLVFAFFYAIFTGEFVGALLALVFGVLGAFVVPFYPLAFWIAMLFQEATSNYYVLWLLLGLPAIGFGFASAAAPAYIIIILIPR